MRAEAKREDHVGISQKVSPPISAQYLERYSSGTEEDP